MARRAGLCDEWYKAWEDDSTLDDCMVRFVDGLDFTIDKRWFDYDFVKQHIPAEVRHRHHVYIDETVSVDDAENGMWVFLGTCTGRLRFQGFAVGRVFLLDECCVEVTGEDYAKVWADVYDNARCDVSGTARMRGH